jgi:hypothetical protein
MEIYGLYSAIRIFNATLVAEWIALEMFVLFGQ